MTIDGLAAIRLVGAPRSGDSFFATTPAGLYITRDGGFTWTQVTPSPLRDEFVFSVAEPGILYAGAGADCYRDGPDEPLFKSVNGGATWHELPEVNLNPVTVHPTDPDQVWAIGCAGPAYSSDGGDTWTTRSDDLFLVYDVSQIVPVRDNWSVVYVGAVSEGGSGAVITTQNGGDEWALLMRESSENPLWWISDLLVLWSAPEHIFMIDPHGFWHSPNAGESWIFRDSGLDDVIYEDGADFSNVGLNALAVDSDITPWTIYLGTQRGVYQSIDEGETWERLTGVSWVHSSVQGLALSRSPDKSETHGQTPRLFVTTEEGVQVFYSQGNR